METEETIEMKNEMQLNIEQFGELKAIQFSSHFSLQHFTSD